MSNFFLSLCKVKVIKRPKAIEEMRFVRKTY